MTAALPPVAPAAGALPAFATVSFAYFAYAGLFATYSPLWFQHLGYSALAIGTLISLQSATRLATPYVWAWLADHSGQRVRLLRWAVAAALIASAGFLVAPSYGWVAVVTVALFLCTAGVIPLSEAALAHWVSSEGVLDAGRYGRVRLWGSIGFILAVSASGFALEARTNQSRVAAVDADGVAVAFGGDFDMAAPADAQMEAAADLLASLLADLGLPVNAIYGRSELERGTSSPGTQWSQGVQWRDELIARVAQRLPGRSAI